MKRKRWLPKDKPKVAFVLRVGDDLHSWLTERGRLEHKSLNLVINEILSVQRKLIEERR